MQGGECCLRVELWMVEGEGSRHSSERSLRLQGAKAGERLVPQGDIECNPPSGDLLGGGDIHIGKHPYHPPTGEGHAILHRDVSLLDRQLPDFDLDRSGGTGGSPRGVRGTWDSGAGRLARSRALQVVAGCPSLRPFRSRRRAWAFVLPTGRQPQSDVRPLQQHLVQDNLLVQQGGNRHAGVDTGSAEISRKDGGVGDRNLIDLDPDARRKPPRDPPQAYRSADRPLDRGHDDAVVAVEVEEPGHDDRGDDQDDRQNSQGDPQPSPASSLHSDNGLGNSSLMLNAPSSQAGVQEYSENAVRYW